MEERHTNRAFNTEEERFEFEHPTLHKLTEDDENYSVLRWTHEARYITLTTFRASTYYKDEDLETALMWQIKIKEEN